MNLDNLLPCPRCGWMSAAIGGACTCKPRPVEPPTIPILRPVTIRAPKPQPRPQAAAKPAPHLPNPVRLDTTTAQQLVARLLGRTPA